MHIYKACYIQPQYHLEELPIYHPPVVHGNAVMEIVCLKVIYSRANPLISNLKK